MVRWAFGHPTGILPGLRRPVYSQAPPADQEVRRSLSDRLGDYIPTADRLVHAGDGHALLLGRLRYWNPLVSRWIGGDVIARGKTQFALDDPKPVHQIPPGWRVLVWDG